MSITNYILTIIGGIVTLIGILSIFYPGLTKIINVPGGERMKSIIAIISGLVIVTIGLVFEIPVN
jgi:hypothetical protein